MSRARATVITALVVLLGGGSSQAAAQSGIGVHLSYAENTELGVGARVAFPVGGLLGQTEASVLGALHAALSLDHYPDCGDDCTYTELNADAHLPVLQLGQTLVYGGTGLSVALTDGPSRFGVNALAGLRVRLRRIGLYTEGRMQWGGIEQSAIRVGVSLGPR